jgi:hypothetical protein
VVAERNVKRELVRAYSIAAVVIVLVVVVGVILRIGALAVGLISGILFFVFGFGTSMWDRYKRKNASK